MTTTLPRLEDTSSLPIESMQSPYKMYESFQEIRKLESPEDWRHWRREIRIKCGIEGWSSLFKLENKDTLPEGSDSDDEYPTKRSWDRKQSIACTLILACCGWSATRLVEDKDTVKEIIDTPEKEYSYRYLDPIQKSTILTQLMNDFNSLTLMGCNNEVSTFTKRLHEIREDMRQLDESCTLMEPFWINKLLDNLGPDFDVFLTCFHSRYNYFPEKDENGNVTKEVVTFPKAVIEALRAEETVKLRRKNPCGHCGRKGHLKESCWELHPHRRPMKRRRN